MRYILLTTLFTFSLCACAESNGKVAQYLNKNAFPGFSLSGKTNYGSVELSGYEYQDRNDKIITITNCKDAANTSISTLPDFEQFRFRLLLNSCEALKNIFWVKHQGRLILLTR